MARRGRGEGTIRRRASDGRWEAIATLGDQRRSFYGKTRAEAREKLAQAQRAYEQGLFVGDQRQTVEQYLEGWLEAKRPPEVKESTWLQYVSRVRTHIIPVVGQVKLARLSPQHVQQVIATAQARGIASSTLGEVHGMLHRALASAVRLELLPRNVVDVVPRPKAATREMRPFTREEAQQFIAAVADHRLSALFHLAISTGMRQGELLGLRWREVDLEAERLSVVASMHWRNVQPVYTEPKSRRSRRQIALSPVMVSKLREHRHRQRLERVAAGPAWQGDVYAAVFTDEVGLPLTD